MNLLKLILRWVLFIPAGFLGIAIIQVLIHLSEMVSHDGQVWENAISSAVDPWAFLTGSLAVLPRGHKAFIVISSVLLGAFSVWLLSLVIHHHGLFTTDIIDPIIDVVSAIVTGVVFYRQHQEPVNTET